LGKVTGHEDAATHRGTIGDAIDPGDAVLEERVGFMGDGEELVEVTEFDVPGIEVGRRDADKSDLDPHDEAGETKAADGCSEEVDVLSR
jgi:hypothetical protein